MKISRTNPYNASFKFIATILIENCEIKNSYLIVISNVLNMNH